MVDCTLKALKDFFESETITSRTEKLDGENPVEVLVLQFGQDEKGREQLIELFIEEKNLVGDERKEIKSPPKKALFVHFRYVFPFEFQDESVNDLARFLLLINKTLEFPGFGISEIDRRIYYRHDLYSDSTRLREDLLKSLLGYILLIVDTFGPKLEQVASLQLTYKEIVDQSLGKK